MFKKFLLVIIFFSSCNVVSAEIFISEVQLSPTEERFIELYNSGDSAVDLTGWYMQRKTATGSSFGSLVSKTNFEGKTIAAHEYFIISRNSFSDSDIVLESLTLTESNTIQIKKSEEEVVDKIGWGSSTECEGSCGENPPEGKSIQKIENSWVVEVPTRGVANEVATSPSPISTPTGSASVSSGTGEAKAKTIEVPKIKAKIVAKNISFAGLPLTFQALATGYEGEKLFYGKFFINFGDGDSKEIPASSGDNFSHTYLYPGDYIVTLEYYSSGNIPEAFHQIGVRVVKSDIAISAVGDEKDFFVELANNTDYEADISGWLLSGKVLNFTFPKNTIIGSKKKMIISSMLTHFTEDARSSLKLMTPQWKVVSVYQADAFSVQKEVNKPIANPSMESTVQTPDKVFESLEIPLKDLEASAIAGDIAEENFYGSYLFAISAFVFIGGSAGAVYFIRRKKIVPSLGSDFKILDE